MSAFKRLLTPVIGLSLVLVALSAAPATHADTSTVGLDLQAGTRSASIANATLTQLTYAHADQHQTGSITLTADDSTGSGSGWNVTVQSSAFAYTGTNGGSSVSAANFSITTANDPAKTAGQTIDVVNGPLAGPSAAGALDVARKVLFANANYGQGTYTQVLNVDLLVPGMARAGTYTGTLTVTVAAGPGA
ncbi:MAG: hypothetical protein HGA65_01720 [Oscillochloris sp.]|nr:hypothetical protein [Oscillochloris sp.]